MEWLLLVFLMIPNWLIEAYKWKFLSNPHHKITLAQSLLQIWKATALGFFTPGRYGEIAARAVLQTQSRVQASYSAGLNSATQSLVTLLFGLLGFSLIGVAALSNTLNVNVWFSVLAILLASGAVVFFIWLTYKNLHSISLTLFVKLLYWCTLRYLVFLGQFVLVLRISGESINPTTFYAIWSYYLLNMMLPVLALIEISVKANVAAWIFPLIGYSAEHAVFAALTIWLVNFILPVLIGHLAILSPVLSKIIQRLVRAFVCINKSCK